MKKSITALILAFLILNVSACNTNYLIDKQGSDETGISTESTENETHKPTENITEAIGTDDLPTCYPEEYYDTVFVENAVLEEFLAKIDLNNTGKLAKYSTDIVSVLLQNGFSEPREIVYERERDDKGNYMGFEALEVAYHDPKCPKETHGACRTKFDIRIFRINPVSIGDRVMVKEKEDIEIYKSPEQIISWGNMYLLKIGEYVACYVSVPDTVIDEKEEKLLDEFVSVAASVRKDLLEIAPELITAT